MARVITVSERSCQADGSFAVRVSFPEAADYDVTVTDPAEPGDEERLAWYFEEHLRFPFLDRDWAEDAVRRLRAYGERLFGQLFAGPAGTDYRILARRGFDGCRLQVQGSAAFHRLHWEALHDPQLPVPAVLRLPVTRRVDLTPAGFELPTERCTLNILVVTARPAGRADVGYRTISRPLLDGLRVADRPVVVDLVRPGTWAAVQQHLRAATKARGSGYYQVIHFDVHGALAGFDDLQTGRFLFGAGRPQAFEGERGFLFFETVDEGRSEPVSAQDVADLLAEHRVPVAVLNACQSAKEPASESSLAQRLVAAGVPVTVGMAYSVTVSAAERAMPLLYMGLAQGDDPVTAMHDARRALFDVKARRAYFDQSIDLEDWVLPVVYAQQDVRLHLSEMPLDQQAEYFEREARVGDEPETEYGFVGRDLDIQAIERRLLIRDDRNMLLVKGMAGAGKSTLLQHLGWWWQRTGLVESVFRFSYEDRAWSLDQIIRDIASAMLDKVEQAKLEVLPAAAQPERIAQLLRSRRHLLVLDNTESITATPAAIPHALPEPERARLAGFLARLRGGKTLVLFGSREDEKWISSRTFGDNVYPLPGLDAQAASELVDAILTRHGGAHYLALEEQRAALDELTKLLGGYPLPLTVVLAALGSHTPAEVLADLRQGGGSADPIGLISRAIEYSHGKLDPITQNSLTLLAPFTASIPIAAIELYEHYLGQHDAVRELGAIDVQAAVAEAIRVGLAAPHPQAPNWVQILPVLPYFLRTRIQQKPGVRDAAEHAHYMFFTAVGDQVWQWLMSTEPQQRIAAQAAVRLDYANLTGALDYGLRSGQQVSSLFATVEEYLDQTRQRDTNRKIIEAAIAARHDTEVPELRRELAEMHDVAGRVARDQRRFEDAESHYRQALDIFLSFGDRNRSAAIYHLLGTLAQHQRHFDEAEARYRQALTIYEESDQRFNAASARAELGNIALTLRRYDEAETNYREALAVFLDTNERHVASSIYQQLGRVAREQRQFEEAEEHHRRAMAIRLEFNDLHGTIGVYHQLGLLAQEQGLFAEAEAHYRQALKTALDVGNRQGTSSIYHQLGVVAQEQDRYEEAEAHYRHALDIELDFNDRYSTSSTRHQLGTVAQEQGRLAEAEEHFREAAQIYLEFDDRPGAVDSLYQLGVIALELDRPEDAEAYHRQGLEIRLESGDRRGAASTYHQLAVIGQRRRRYEDAARAAVQAGVIWHDLFDVWPEPTLDILREVRPELSAETIEEIGRDSPDLLDELTA